MATLDFLNGFYGLDNSRATLFANVDSVLDTSGIGVRAVPFSSDIPPSDLFRNASGTSASVNCQTKYDGVELFKLTYSYKQAGQKHHNSGSFFVYQHPRYPKLSIAITLEQSHFFRHGLLPFLTHVWPNVVLPFVPHKRMQTLLSRFQDTNGFTELTIRRASQRLRLPEEGRHKRTMPVVSWPDMPMNQAFDWVYQNNGWFQSLQFGAKRNYHVAAEIFLGRDGVVCTDRLFSKIYEGFLDPICKNHHENISLFSNRGRLETPHHAAKPLVVDFQSNQFEDLSENAKFIRAMKGLARASVSVIHGNPYVHLAIVDYTDGSVFDVWILSAQHLIVVPQMKGSVAAIKRIINHVFDTYAEGELREFAEAIG